MSLKKRKLVGGFNRYRLILTLGVAVLLPAAGLIYVNFSQLREFERDNFLEAAIHRDFQEFLAISEKELNKKAYGLVDDARDQFPSADASVDEKEQKLDEILSHCSCFLHLFVYDAEKGIVLRTQPNQLNDEYVQEEHDSGMDSYKAWFKVEGRYFVETKKPHKMTFQSGVAKRAGGEFYEAVAIFPLPGASKDRVLLGGAVFDPIYLKKNFFPKMIDDVLAERLAEYQSGNPMAMMVYLGDAESMEMKSPSRSRAVGEKANPK